MALRNNRAAQFNRHMMWGMLLLGIVVIGCVFAFLYMSTSKEANPFATKSDGDTQQKDSVVLELVGDEAALDELIAE